MNLAYLLISDYITNEPFYVVAIYNWNRRVALSSSVSSCQSSLIVAYVSSQTVLLHHTQGISRR